MKHAPIVKRAEDIARCNMPSYEETVAGFSWDAARKLLDGLPAGGLNIAYEAVDRHVAHGRGDATRFALARRRWARRRFHL